MRVRSTSGRSASAARRSSMSSDISVFPLATPPPSPHVNVDATGGATANAASAAAVSFGSSDIGIFSPSATDNATMPTASAVTTLVDPPSPDVAVAAVDSTTDDIPPTDDSADETAADTHASAVDAGAQVSPPRKRRRHLGPTEAARLRLRQQAHAPTDDTADDTAADTHASAVDAGAQVSPPHKRRRHLGPAEAARLRLHQQARTSRSPRAGHE